MTTTIKGQVLASTEVDSHGERRDKQFLDDLVASMPSRMPLNQHHDLGKPIIGFIENFRVEASGEGWALKGDVTFDGPPPTSGGFSFSKTEVVLRADEPLFSLFVPYPYYNDATLLHGLGQANADTSVGKWIKKSAQLGEIALIISTINFLFGPIWKKVYDEKVYPRLAKLAGSAKAMLHQKSHGRSVRVEYLQPVTFDAYEGPIELYFIPTEHVELDLAYGFAVKDAIEAGMSVVESDWKASNKPIKRIVYVFEADACMYQPTQIIHQDGSTRAP